MRHHVTAWPGSSAKPRRAGPGLLALRAVAALAGWIMAAYALVSFTIVGDPCPAWEDEGTMAAPASPYSRLMCDPALPPDAAGDGLHVPLPVAALVAAVAPVLVAGAAARRRSTGASRRAVTAGVVLTAVVAPAIVVALHVALPRDCLSGRTETGDCTRDRELR